MNNLEKTKNINRLAVVLIIFLLQITLQAFVFTKQSADAAEGSPLANCLNEAGNDEQKRQACIYQAGMQAGDHCRAEGFQGEQYTQCYNQALANGPDAGGNGYSANTPNAIENDCEGPIKAGDGSCGIIDYLVIFINILSGMAGVVILGSMIYGGIQYSSASSDPQRVSAAKERIRNAIIALIFFVFGFAIINYLIPGGLM